MATGRLTTMGGVLPSRRKQKVGNCDIELNAKGEVIKIVGKSSNACVINGNLYPLSCSLSDNATPPGQHLVDYLHEVYSGWSINFETPRHYGVYASRPGLHGYIGDLQLAVTAYGRWRVNFHIVEDTTYYEGIKEMQYWTGGSIQNERHEKSVSEGGHYVHDYSFDVVNGVGSLYVRGTTRSISETFTVQASRSFISVE